MPSPPYEHPIPNPWRRFAPSNGERKPWEREARAEHDLLRRVPLFPLVQKLMAAGSVQTSKGKRAGGAEKVGNPRDGVDVRSFSSRAAKESGPIGEKTRKARKKSKVRALTRVASTYFLTCVDKNSARHLRGVLLDYNFAVSGARRDGWESTMITVPVKYPKELHHSGKIPSLNFNSIPRDGVSSEYSTPMSLCLRGAPDLVDPNQPMLELGGRDHVSFELLVRCQIFVSGRENRVTSGTHPRVDSSGRGTRSTSGLSSSTSRARRFEVRSPACSWLVLWRSSTRISFMFVVPAFFCRARADHNMQICNDMQDTERPVGDEPDWVIGPGGIEFEQVLLEGLLRINGIWYAQMNLRTV